jgi:hypothetical protein
MFRITTTNSNFESIKLDESKLQVTLNDILGKDKTTLIKNIVESLKSSNKALITQRFQDALFGLVEYTLQNKYKLQWVISEVDKKLDYYEMFLDITIEIDLEITLRINCFTDSDFFDLLRVNKDGNYISFREYLLSLALGEEGSNIPDYLIQSDFKKLLPYDAFNKTLIEDSRVLDAQISLNYDR